MLPFIANLWIGKEVAYPYVKSHKFNKFKYFSRFLCAKYCFVNYSEYMKRFKISKNITLLSSFLQMTTFLSTCIKCLIISIESISRTDWESLLVLKLKENLFAKLAKY